MAYAMASIVIPAYNNYHLLHGLLFDLYKTTPQGTEIVVVDDCSPDEQLTSGLEWWNSTMLAGRLKVIRNETNQGFLLTSNIGVDRATNEVVVLISTDVKVRDRSMISSISMALDEDVPVLVGARLYGASTGWNEFDGTVFPYLEGWLLGFKKSQWKSFGGFDTRYAPNDFEDVDISTTYIRNGGKLVGVSLDVEHIGAQSIGYSPEREAVTKTNREKFREKWIK